MAFRINLKDESFTYTIDKDYEKAMFLKLKINGDDCKKSEINVFMVILSVIAFIFIVSDNELKAVGIIIGVFVAKYWYDIIRENYLYRLCKDVKKERG